MNTCKQPLSLDSLEYITGGGNPTPDELLNLISKYNLHKHFQTLEIATDSSGSTALIWDGERLDEAGLSSMKKTINRLIHMQSLGAPIKLTMER